MAPSRVAGADRLHDRARDGQRRAGEERGEHPRDPAPGMSLRIPMAVTVAAYAAAIGLTLLATRSARSPLGLRRCAAPREA